MSTLEEQIGELFKQGFGQRSIAKEIHISTNRVARILNQLELKRTSNQQGEVIRNKRRATLPLEKLKQYYFENKLSLDEIAKKLNLGHSQLKRRVSELGWSRETTLLGNISEKVQNITKEQIEDLYIKQNKSSHDCQEILNISRGSWKKLIRKFNIKKDYNVIQKNKFTNLKHNLLKKYKVDNPINVPGAKEKIEQTNLQRYGTINYASTEAWKNKHSATRKKNGTWNSSIFEEKAYQLLLTKFNNNDIDRQHKDTEYPFNCDFYIKSLKLYIEIQGSVFHDRKPFDPSDDYCQNRLNQLLKRDNTYSDQIIDIWTNKDVIKRNTAKKNRLNYKEFFTLKEFENWFNTI